MNQRLVAVCLAVYAGCTLAGILPGAVLAAKSRQPALAVLAAAVAVTVAATLADGAALLW